MYCVGQNSFFITKFDVPTMTNVSSFTGNTGNAVGGSVYKTIGFWPLWDGSNAKFVTYNTTTWSLLHASDPVPYYTAPTFSTSMVHAGSVLLCSTYSTYTGYTYTLWDVNAFTSQDLPAFSITFAAALSDKSVYMWYRALSPVTNTVEYGLASVPYTL